MYNANKKKLRLSMSSPSTPKSNAVSERLNRTIKVMLFNLRDLNNYPLKNPILQQNVDEYKKLIRQFMRIYRTCTSSRCAPPAYT
jgi:transposase InsO family protein